MSSSLCWQPIYPAIESRIRDGDKMIMALVAFSKLDAVKRLWGVQGTQSRVRLICRWRPSDIASGASDLEVFEYLRDAGSELYINQNLHMKLYLFESNMALNTSANLTLSGLGYGERANVEVGSVVRLDAADWAGVYDVVSSSRQVDESVYQRFRQIVRSPVPVEATNGLDLLPAPKRFSIGSLPASDTPKKLFEFYSGRTVPTCPPEDIRKAMHDIVVFGVPLNLDEGAFERVLGEAFRRTPFVAEFLALLRLRGSLRFGAVNAWIHETCEDVPLPYRWEVKENTRIFFDWLSYYVPGVSWSRPNHSQVIHWQQSS